MINTVSWGTKLVIDPTRVATALVRVFMAPSRISVVEGTDGASVAIGVDMIGECGVK